MAIAAKISSTELDEQVRARFVDQYFEIALVNAPGITYTPGTTDDADFMTDEVASTGGYERQIIGYSSGDVGVYADDGVGLATKAAVFAQDGSGNNIEFTHVVQLWGSGQALTTTVGGTEPTNQVANTYTNVPCTTVTGSGTGLTVDLTSDGTNFTAVVAGAGKGYAANDTVVIANATLLALGAVTAGSVNDLSITVNTVYNPSNAGDILSVSKTGTSVTLSGGQEAAFYFNLKQYGYYTP